MPTSVLICSKPGSEPMKIERFRLGGDLEVIHFMESAVENPVHAPPPTILVLATSIPMAPKVPVFAVPLFVVCPAPAAADCIAAATFELARSLGLRPAQKSLRILSKKLDVYPWARSVQMHALDRYVERRVRQIPSVHY